MEQATLNRVREAMEKAITRCEQHRELMKNISGPPQEGHIFLLSPTPPNCDFVWAALYTHPDDPNLLFCVPADTHPLSGLCDVTLADNDHEAPLVLRCGYGLYLHQEDLPLERRVGILTPAVLKAARQKMGEMAGGKLTGNPTQWRNEDNPDYETWCQMVARASCMIETATRGV